MIALKDRVGLRAQHQRLLLGSYTFKRVSSLITLGWGEPMLVELKLRPHSCHMKIQGSAVPELR